MVVVNLSRDSVKRHGIGVLDEREHVRTMGEPRELRGRDGRNHSRRIVPGLFHASEGCHSLLERRKRGLGKADDGDADLPGPQSRAAETPYPGWEDPTHRP